MNQMEISNKGFQYRDLAEIFRSEMYRELMALIHKLGEHELQTTTRGTLRFTNLNDSSGRFFRHTVHYLRAWEYVRLISIPKLDKEKRKVLCLGEGSTPLLFLLGELGHDVTVVDLERDLIRNSQIIAHHLGYPIQCAIGDMTTLSYSDATFDAVLSCSVIEHLNKDHKIAAMSEMGRVLKTGGTIGVSFDYGGYQGSPLTGEAHEAIAFEEIERLLVRPSGCKPLGALMEKCDQPYTLKPRYWKFAFFQYYPYRLPIFKSLFYTKLPYSYYTLFLRKEDEAQ